MKHHPAILAAAALVALISLAAPTTQAQAKRSYSAYDIARQFELQPMAEQPEWATSETPPLFTFAWMSDFHLRKGKTYELVKAGCNYTRDTLKPDFVVITGDNSAYALAPKKHKDKKKAKETLPLRRQQALQQFLAKELAIPYSIVPGDNWPWEFEKVFGPTQYSFDVGGMHFLFLSVDCRGKGKEGCAVFLPTTWKWLQEDLRRNAQKPTLFFTHEPVHPPSFLEAAALNRVLSNAGNVLAALCGHIHLDLDFRRENMAHLVCPSLGVRGTHGFKLVKVHPERIVLETYEFDGKSFVQARKWQKIDIPGRLRKGLGKPRGNISFTVNRSEIPPHPLVRDQELLQRAPELVGPAAAFAMELTLSRLFSPPPVAKKNPPTLKKP
ncbi:MAG: metallophosphoesterase [Lentisphaeria bacterium]|nr:metallophosphoesterase [Lentisphaeria bacterium]